MSSHMELSELSKFCSKITGWLNARYGEEQGGQIWNAVCEQYNEYMKEIPDYGDSKNTHALAIYGAILIFSLYPLLPDHPPVEELQDLVQNMFMEPFVKLGKILDLNRKMDMKLINFVFKKTGDKERKQIKQYPDTFCNVEAPFDKENCARHIRLPSVLMQSSRKNTVLCTCSRFSAIRITGVSARYTEH